jgi:hypothetical protein
MKHIQQTLIVLAITMTLFSCQDKIEETFVVNEPQYMSYEDLRVAFDVVEPQEIIQPGKIYFKDNLIFVNEYQKGIHVVFNEDPSNPIVIKFIEIPGNVDLAIKGNILFADSYVDLLAIDISNLDDIYEVTRIEDAFPYIIPEVTEGMIDDIDESKGVITGWSQVKKTVKVEREDYNYPQFRSWEMGFATVDMASASPAVSGEGIGVGGSMARFTLYDKYLYAVDISMLRLFNVSTAAYPKLEKEINIGWNIETIFPYEEKLFIGSRTGMIIYSLEDASNPTYISEFWHASSCDPVVVEGDYAYVTLRAGNICGNDISQLDVIDISNIQYPELVKIYPMEEPYGLGIDNSVLFICDGNAGLKIYNAEDPETISSNMLASYPEINAFDVIPLGNVLLMIGIDGLYQYDYSDLENIYQLSHIPIYGQPNE